MEKQSPMTVEIAKGELNALPLNADFLAALSDPAHPGHKVAAARRNELYQSAYPASEGSDVVESAEATRPEDNSADPNAFWQAPDRAQDYQFDPVPHGLEHDADLDQLARGWFHTAGAPAWLARNVVREWNRSVASPPDEQSQEAAAVATEKSLRQRWGESYEAKINLARSVIDDLNDGSVYDLLERSGMGNNEYLIRQLVALAEGRRVGEEG